MPAVILDLLLIAISIWIFRIANKTRRTRTHRPGLIVGLVVMYLFAAWLLYASVFALIVQLGSM
jgi:hypothetical protein